MSEQDWKDPTSNDQYWCFISYRHADNHEQDRNWASWLHQEIERYDVPAELVGTKNKRGDTIPERIYPVFRDEDSLPADADLGNSIVNALNRSRFMVALCSPRSVESKYCTQEILHFKQTGKQDRLIAAILDGEPGEKGNECFCSPLIHPVSDEGDLDTSTFEEPIAADFRIREGNITREGFTSAEAYRLSLLDMDHTLSKREIRERVESYDAQLQLMKLKIIAGILGVPLELLRDRDKAYQLELARKQAQRLRRWLVVVISLGLAALAAGGIASWQGNIAKVKGIEASAQLLAAQARLQVQDTFFETDQRAVLLALESLKLKPTIQGDSALRVALANLPGRPNRFEPARELVAFSKDGTSYITNGIDEEETTVLVRSVSSNEILQTFDLGKPSFEQLTISQDGKFLALARDGNLEIWSISDAALLQRHRLENFESWEFKIDTPTIILYGKDQLTEWQWNSNVSTKFELPHPIQSSAFQASPGLIGYNTKDALFVRYNYETEKVLTFSLDSPDANVESMNPDGTLLATTEIGPIPSTVTLWDIEKSIIKKTILNDWHVSTAMFSRDGDNLVVITAPASFDPANPDAVLLPGHTIKVFQLKPWLQLTEIRLAEEQGFYTYAFSGDRNWLYTSGGSGSRIWNLYQANLIEEACSRLSRNLSPSESKYFLELDVPPRTCEGLPFPDSSGDF